MFLVFCSSVQGAVMTVGRDVEWSVLAMTGRLATDVTSAIDRWTPDVVICPARRSWPHRMVGPFSVDTCILLGSKSLRLSPGVSLNTQHWKHNVDGYWHHFNKNCVDLPAMFVILNKITFLFPFILSWKFNTVSHGIRFCMFCNLTVNWHAWFPSLQSA